MTHEDWQAERMAALAAEDGWLNLTDRVEIPPGPQRVGRGADCDLVLSVGPELLGVIEADATSARLDGVPFAASGGNPMLRKGNLLLELHTVDGIPALRVRDLDLKRDVKITSYPHDPAWVIEAEWLALPPRPQAVEQKGGGLTEVTLTHAARFTHGGQEVTLLATHWKAGKPMFVIRDATSGRTTYAASRFLIAEPEGARITLDFNRAHNPPCAFTDFAICPLPPRENRLPFAIEAGEMRLGQV
ncbi:DUF1684 domain-containing protein [Stagnihabitans tardus]|uniref:DUF1684 domain-containing protein n=1 Tax=Stagnihabitans tardus TaxID=2699202 RepID=A0AAE5BU96_9RHOB|nr:DUF1684 domain-containing protein [Stagnihabitans tardus]NBZ87621.1 DUF1684 domain-containing protein [Stagnihabitans tardus]